jgi:YHS domain-containing protein
MHMQKRITSFSIAAWVLLATLSSSGLVWAGVEKGQTCPVMIGRPVKEKFFVDHNGKRIYLCCGPCVKAFSKHPEKYAKNL